MNQSLQGQGFWSIHKRAPLSSLGIQYIGVFNFRYTVYLCSKLGIKYSLMTKFGYKVYSSFLNFGILYEFSYNFCIIGLLEGLLWLFWYSTTSIFDNHQECNYTKIT